MGVVTTILSQTATAFNNGANINLLATGGNNSGRGSFNGTPRIVANQTALGDSISLHAYGVLATGNPPEMGVANTLQMRITWSPGPNNGVVAATVAMSLIPNRPFVGWELTALISMVANQANNLGVCEAFFSCPDQGIRLAPMVLLGAGRAGNSVILNFPIAQTIGLWSQFSVDTNVLTMEQCSILYLQRPNGPPPPAATMAQGNIDGNVPPAAFTPGGPMVGTLSATAVYVGGTFYGATAYQDLGTTANTSSVTFNYQGAEAADKRPGNGLDGWPFAVPS